MPERKRKRLARIGTILAVGLLIGFVSFPLLSGVVAPVVPNAVLSPIGAHMVTTTAESAPLCSGEAGTAALNKLATKLATASGSDREFKIYVAKADELNAFAAPGGHIVLYKAILDHARSPNEVAGVLAHEMGHVVEDHPAKAVVEAFGYNIFGLLVPGSDSTTSEVAKTLLTSAHSRADELDADRVGVQMLNAAELDSHGLIGFFKTLDEGGNKIPGALQFLSTHPAGDTRTNSLQDFVQDGAPAMTPDEWASFKAICDTTGNAEPVTVGG